VIIFTYIRKRITQHYAVINTSDNEFTEDEEPFEEVIEEAENETKLLGPVPKSSRVRLW